MTIGKVLSAYDGSEASEKAFDYALDIAHKYGAELLVLSVAGLPETPDRLAVEDVEERAAKHYRKPYEKLQQKAAAAQVNLGCEIRVGRAARQIIRMAEEKKVDLIVMGHGRKGVVARWLLGSVSKRVLSYAPCTVTVVR